MFRDHQSRPPHSDTSDVLAGRLRTGEQLIEVETDTNRRMELEDYWLCLLHDYERCVDRERQQADRQVSA